MLREVVLVLSLSLLCLLDGCFGAFSSGTMLTGL